MSEETKMGISAPWTLKSGDTGGLPWALLCKCREFLCGEKASPTGPVRELLCNAGGGMTKLLALRAAHNDPQKLESGGSPAVARTRDVCPTPW